MLNIGGEEWLRYKAFPINVAFIRGTTCDPNGNTTMEREALTLDNLAIAMAAKNSGGFVITQVERIAAGNSLNPREVQVPGIFWVDCVVLGEVANHLQTYDGAPPPTSCKTTHPPPRPLSLSTGPHHTHTHTQVHKPLAQAPLHTPRRLAHAHTRRRRGEGRGAGGRERAETNVCVCVCVCVCVSGKAVRKRKSKGRAPKKRLQAIHHPIQIT